MKLLSALQSEKSFDTVVWGSSPHGPTISFSELASTTSLDKAPIGSLREGVRNYRGHLLNILRAGHMYSYWTANRKRPRKTTKSVVQDSRIFGPIRSTWRLRERQFKSGSQPSKLVESSWVKGGPDNPC
jgi:hypothetical protein